MFDANLQEFAARVGNTCGLESNGKITPHEAYDRIKALWKALRRTKQPLLTAPAAKPRAERPPNAAIAQPRPELPDPSRAPPWPASRST